MDPYISSLNAPCEYIVLGVPCTAYVNHAAAVEHVKALVSSGASGYTVALNAEKLVRCQDDANFRRLVEKALVKVPDGAGAVLALSMLQRVQSAKIDFPAAVLEAASELGEKCRLAVIGATEASNAAAVAEIRCRYPRIPIVLRRNGYVAADHLLGDLQESRPNICLVAMGSPKQELFSAGAALKQPSCVFVGCGGALDILSGQATRVPRWMVDNYTEWPYRLMKQPTRWRRQSALPVFVVRLLTARLRAMLG
jgi:N-acetylglucosaminyldiphosphoundecaprenol N-acetyl-beta-D-mannosaminyltransferase